MPRNVLINLPVKDLLRSKEFFSSIKLLLDKGLSDENATCFIVQDDVFIALLPEEHFKEITKGGVSDTAKNHEVLVAIGLNSKAEVDEFVNSAIGAGGKELHEPQDLGWIYGRSFSDLDGHQWNINYMDIAAKRRTAK